MNIYQATKADYKVIQHLYTSAFPLNERVPFFLLKRRIEQNKASMLVAKANKQIIGFAYTVCYKNLVYLFYFAIAKDKRKQGNGSQILQLLKSYFSGAVIFLAREPLDKKANNYNERVSRRNFYLKNGFIDLPFQIREANVVFDLMSTDKDFNASDYNILIQNWAGAFYLKFIKMELVE